MAAKSDAARPSVCPIEGEAFRAQCEKNVLFFSFVSSQRGNDQTGKPKEKNVRK